MNFPSALATIERAYAEADSRCVIAVDGRSGSGKTTLAAALAERWAHLQVLHLDDLYPGWDGLADGARRAREVVDAWRCGESSTFTPTAWPGVSSREPVTIVPGRALLVEGVGAAWAASPATLTVWVERDTATRRQGAMRRDGDAYAPHWDAWATQEDAWFADNATTPDVIVESD